MAKVDYLRVELVLRSKPDEVINGFVRGLLNRNGADFLVISGANTPGEFDLYNMLYYDVLMIETLHVDYKTIMCATKEKDDQDDAISVIKETLKVLLESGCALLEDSEIIDFDKYKNIPAEFKKVDPATGKSEETRNTSVGNFASRTDDYRRNTYASGHTHSGHSYSTYTKKDPEPTFFRRKSALPTKESIVAMSAKAAAIIKKEIKPVIPYIKEDPPEDDKTSAAETLASAFCKSGYGIGI